MLDPNMKKNEWLATAREWLDHRRGLWNSEPDESLVGYVGAFEPVYAAPSLNPDEPLFVWFVFPGRGVAACVVNWIARDVFVDHEGTVHEHPEEWTLVLGTVRRGRTPLLTKEMINGV